MHKFLVLSAVLALSGVNSPARAAAPDLDAFFSVTADGWNLGELEATYKETGKTYDVTLKGGATGLWGFFLQATYDGRSSGTFSPSGALVPDVFEARSHRIFKSRHQQVDFTNGRPVNVSIDPERDLTNMSDPSLVTDRRIDPMSYLGIFIQNRSANCPAPGDLYDGRRTTRISFNRVASDTADIACDGTYELIKGPDHSIRKGFRKFSVRLEYQADPAGNGSRLARLDFTSGGNTLVLSRLK